ncbi:MAG: GTPase HflX [Leptospiraceae bacterium]|nr:GTPase HflX [Leptospiraceae bacterium]
MDASSLYSHSLRTVEATKYIALLVGQYGSREFRDKRVQEESLRELYHLCDTAGISMMQDLFLHIHSPDPGCFLNAGMIETVKESLGEDKCNLLVVDAPLKPNQLRNLEERLKVRVIGRIELILDIFAMRAKTRAAALQVELAQLTYILPRLTGLGGVLSRLGGGIGTRGPGETMLETDRRHIRRRIQKLKEELVSVSKHRANARKNRELPTFALAGYTNAGKSTILNCLGSSPRKVIAEDRLFATLDSFSRKVYIGEKDYKPVYAMVTDTVGFIRNLPANLVAAFSSTLEEISFADAIIEVHDAASPQLEDEIHVVAAELERLHISDKERIIFFNKADLVFPEQRAELERRYPAAIWGSALQKDGVEGLRNRLRQYAEDVWWPEHTAAALSKKDRLY